MKIWIDSQLIQLSHRITDLLNHVGDKSYCKGCGAEIYWVLHRNGKRQIYDPDGAPHRSTCPKARGRG